MNATQPLARSRNATATYRWIGAALLLVAGYIHLGLFFDMSGFAQTLGRLFLLNAVGAFAAMLLIVGSARWFGWALGIPVAGGAALARLAMNQSPGLLGLLTGRGRGFGRLGRGGFALRRPSLALPGNGHFAAGHAFASGTGHAALPLFLGMGTLGTLSIVVELAFVALAVYALLPRRTGRSAPAPG